MMKKIFVAILIFLGTFLSAQEASIREFSGTVEVKTPGASVWRAARIGERISKDTIISTGFRSTAFIDVGNSTLIVRPLTRLSLESLQRTQNNESVALYLETGRVRAEVKAPLDGNVDFSLHAPIVTASVRGTAFDFDGTNLNVDEGQVYFTGGDKIGVYVGAGHQSVSDPETGRTVGAAELFLAELTMTGPKVTHTSANAPAKTPARVTRTRDPVRVLSANANLGGLAVDYGLMDYFFNLSPDFNADTTNYTVTVSLTSEINVTATTSDPRASITINGERVSSGVPKTISGFTIGGGRIVIPVVVTAEDGKTKKTYTITASRPLI
jgi:hypothetical protein